LEIPVVVADGDRLPFRPESFEGIVCVNLLEHLSRPNRLVRECHRVLSPGGTLLLVTPNGDAAWALELAEVLRLKLPEGPHRFLRQARLRALVRDGFDVLHHAVVLACPVRPWRLAHWIEGLRSRHAPRAGLAQWMIARKQG
jgi:SAM-dependent methyltransferase